LCVVTDSSVAMFLRPTSRPAVAARKRRTKEVWLLGAGGGAGGSGVCTLCSSSQAAALVRCRYSRPQVAQACSSSFDGGSYRISAWRPSLRLPQVVSSPVEAATAAPGGLRPSTAKLDSIACAIFVGVFSIKVRDLAAISVSFEVPLVIVTPPPF
jgi:hypothetical protein